MIKRDTVNLRSYLRKMVRELGMLNRACSGTELSPLQSHILIELNAKPSGVTELASQLCVDKASMSRTLSSLINSGVIIRSNNQSDRRFSEFCLSELGKEKLSLIEDNSNKFIEEALSSSSDSEYLELFQAIKGFSTSLRNNRRQKEADMTIRKIEEKDNEAIAEIIRSSFVENKIDHLEGVSLHDPSLSRLSDFYVGNQMGYWVVEANGIIVGGAGIYPLDGEDGVCEMQKLYFSRKVKGMGMGRRMIAFILEKASEMKYKQCYIETLDELKDAVKLYESFGFVHLPESLGNTGHSSCNICMLRTL